MHKSVSKAATKQIDISHQNIPKNDKKNSSQRFFRIDIGTVKEHIRANNRFKIFHYVQRF